jgi:hypothetical protein
MEVSNPLDLLSTKMCSPLVIYIVIVIISGISLYMSRSVLKRYKNQKMENLYNLFAWHEVKLLIIKGVILYGLCQYNQVNLAWIFLLFPICYLIMKNLMIFFFVSLAHQNAPQEVEQPAQLSSQGQQAMLQQVVAKQQQESFQQAKQPVNKSINMGGDNLTGFSPPLNQMSF